MGYDLYITRLVRSDPAAGGFIPREQWEEIATADPELIPGDDPGEYLWEEPGSATVHCWFAWSDGKIHTKSPDSASLTKMRLLAARLNAVVVGADGEIYTGAGTVGGPLPRRSLADAARSLLSFLIPFRSAPNPGLHPGDRVRDPGSDTGTVERVDRRANRGLGLLVVRYDDGRVSRTTIVGGTVFSRIAPNR